MKSVTDLEMKRIDKKTQENIPSFVLMESVGKKMANVIIDRYHFKKVLIIAGSGGNGGDSYVIARYLLENNKDVYVYQAKKITNLDTKKNYDLYKGKIVNDLEDLNYDIIIDGLLGIGFIGELSLDYINIIKKINDSKITVVSLDIPSGLNSLNGKMMPVSIKCELCIAVKYPKVGLFLNDGPDTFSKIEVIDCEIMSSKNTIDIFHKENFYGMFKKRLRNSNKSTYKRASLIAGSYKYPGASMISYNALLSLKMGIGYSYLYVPYELYELYLLKYPEIIVSPLSSKDNHIKFNKEQIDEIIKKSDSISIGMGMDISIDLYETIEYLLKNYDKTLIIDADGLNSISKYGVDILKNKKANVIITPHIKEASRLFNVSIKDILKDPIKYAKDFSNEYNLTVILKNNTTVIAQNNNIGINIYGNTGLAKGGSGDALTGILSGICAYMDGYDNYLKSALSCYILGYASILCNNYLEVETMTITDITKYISDVIKDLKQP